MEDKSLPPAQVVQPRDASDSLEAVDDTQSVASYSLPQKNYPLETLEVHTEGQPTAAPAVAAALPVPYSRRKAMIVSLIITIIVVLITGAVAAFFVSKPQENQQRTPTQDVNFNSGLSDEIPPELKGANEALLVNGDVITRGNLKVASGSFSTQLSSQTLTANQAIEIPNASGTLCLDSNNCNFAPLTQVTQLQTQLAAGTAGVGTLNGQAGTLTLQGSLNQVNVTTTNGVITLSTPQNLNANANVQFGSLNLGSSLPVTSGGTGTNTLTANGVLVGNGTNAVTSVIAGGAGQCLVSTVGAPAFQACPGGGGSVTSLNSMTGAITIQGTANQIIVSNGAGTITLSTPQDINTNSDVTFDAMELTGLLHSTSSIDIDSHGAIGPGSTLSPGAIQSGNTLIVSDTFVSGEDCTFACAAISAFAEKGDASAIFMDAIRGQIKVGDGQALNTGSAFFAEGSVVGSGATLTNNYGLFVATQSAGTNDYGVYIQHADTYGLWVDSGATRLDGTLEVQTLGTTNTATFLCRNASNQLAACNTTGNGAAFLQGGNAFGATAVLGTTDTQALNLVTGGAGNTRLSISSTGSTTVTGGTSGVALTVNNSTSTGDILNLQDNGSNVLTVADGGNVALTADLAVNGGDITSSGALNVDAGGTISLQDNTDINGHLGLGNTGAPGAVAVFNLSESYNGTDCSFGCYGMFSTVTANGVIGTNPGIVGAYSLITISSGTATSVASFSAANPTGAGAVTNNYGLLVENMTKGTNDYGVYIQGADTYALWVDAGTTRLDGTLDVQSGSLTNTIGALSVTSATTNAITLDSGTTGAVNVGTGANAKTVTVGSTTGAAATTIQAGSGGISLSATTTTASGTLTIQGGGGSTEGLNFTQDTTRIGFGTAGVKPWILGPRDANNYFTLTYMGSEAFAFGNAGLLAIGNAGAGTSNPDARLEIKYDLDKDAWGLNGIQIQVDAASYTDLTSTGTVSDVAFNSFAQPTLDATNTVTYTNAATIYVQNAPVAGGDETITNAYSLWIDNGTTRLDGTLQVGSAILPSAAGTLDIGSATAEFDELYLGDDSGLVLGADQDATLGYDEATDDRVELTGSGASLFIEDRLMLGVQTFTMTTAGAATENLTPTSSYIEITGQDNGADLAQIQTTGAKEGTVLYITNLDATNVGIDQNATTKLSGGADVTLTQYDVIMLIFDGANWLQAAAVTNNS